MDNCFPAIVGNDKLKRRLATEIREGRFPHAYILAGKDGSGKMTLAMQIAAALACKDRYTLPCGECDSCKKILGGFSPDVPPAPVLSVSRSMYATTAGSALFSSSTAYKTAAAPMTAVMTIVGTSHSAPAPSSGTRYPQKLYTA